jgi:hypothetical protein
LLELTWIPAALRILGWVLAAAAVYAIYAAFAKPKTNLGKGIAIWLVLTVVGGLFLGPQLASVLARRDYDKKLEPAVAAFQARCKLSGEKITRTVEDVEGVVWLKWRDEKSNFDDQFKLDDPYGSDCGGEACILYLLRVTVGVERNPEDAKAHRGMYRFVETTDPSDGRRYRYRAVVKSVSKRTTEQIEQYKRNTGAIDPGPDVYGVALERQPIEQFSARYGITWDDISTREDREHWIAGGSLKVIDLKTQEVIAERIGYMMDRGLGSTAGGRSPWGDAPKTACPPFPRAAGGGPYMSNRADAFITRVLVPAREK